MLQLDRQKQILDYLKKNRKATTNELSELLGVSTTTIRTDLNQMDKDCLLKKTHGGAVYRDNNMERAELTGRAYYFDERALENKEEKEKIANEAVKLVKDHMCIFLDASSTAYTLYSAQTGGKTEKIFDPREQEIIQWVLDSQKRGEKYLDRGGGQRPRDSKRVQRACV